MSDIGNPTWSPIDASNTAAPPNGAPEGWLPSDVNNWGRATMGGVKRFWQQINPTLTTTGTSTAYVLTYTVAPQSIYEREAFSFSAHVTCGAAPTLNINSLGAGSLRKFNGTTWVVLAAGDLKANQIITAAYNTSDTSYYVVEGLPDAPFTGGTLTTTTNMSGVAFNEAQGANIASATTTNIGAATGNSLTVTGTTTITGLGTVQAGTERTVTFSGILTLTHNATSLILPGAANIITAAGDVAIFRSLGSGNWRCVNYQRATVAPYGVVAFLANKNSVNQTLTDETWTKLTFGTENFDLGAYYNTANSRWTPPAGTYLINGRWGATNIGTANVGSIAIYVNGSRVYSNTIADGNGVRDYTVAITQIMNLNGTDYVELWGYVNTAGGSVTVLGDTEYTTFSGSRL